MYSSFDFVKLNALLKDFHRLTGMRITVYDDACREITSFPTQIAPVCRFIRTNPAAEAACHACDRDACRAALEKRGPYVYRCHAGLTEAVAPVFTGNIVAAYVSFGHLFCYPSRAEGREAILGCCAPYGLDAAALGGLTDALPDTDGETILAAAHVLEALASYLCLDRAITLKQQPLQVRIDAYISAHFAEDIRADSLCRRFNIGRTALYEFARQNYGMGIARHVRRLRIDHARRLLADRPELNIGEIAEACGFSDYNYFITLFSRTVGMSPRKYRLSQTLARDPEG